WGLWLSRGVWRLPLLWVLYIGYAWLPLGLALLGSAALGLWSDSLLMGVHALTLGCIGTLTLGMMARVSLGHTGRPLQPSPAVVLAFVLISLAAVVRVLMPWLDISRYLQWLQWSGLLWTTA